MQIDRCVLPASTPGSSRFLQVWRFGEPEARPHVYLQAGLHADEWPGLLVLQWLLPLLQEAEQAGRLRGRLTVVPYANPVGLAQGVGGYLSGRFELNGSGNFNRQFPDLRAALDGLELARKQVMAREPQRWFAHVRNWLSEQPCEDETAVLKRQLLLLSCDADVVLDLHCDDQTEAHLYACREQSTEASRLAARLGFPFVFLEDTTGVVAFDGSHLQPWVTLGQLLPDPQPMPVFAATLEYRGQTDVSDPLARSDALRLYHALSDFGVIDVAEQAPPEARPPLLVTDLAAVDVITAPRTGLVVFACALGDWVEEGALFAEIVILDGPVANERIAVPVRASGYVVGLSQRYLVRPGQGIGKIAGRDLLSWRDPTSLLQP